MPRLSAFPLRLRGVLVLLALLSQVGFGNAQSLQCAMHGMGAVQAGAAAAVPADMQHEPAHHENGGGTSHDCHCTCVGDCSSVVSVPAAPLASTLRIAIVVARPRHAFDVAPSLPAHFEPERLLPFANGPPATALL